MHREERRLQYVAVGGVAIGGGRWRVTTVRGRNGAAVVGVGRHGMRVGKGYEVAAARCCVRCRGAREGLAARAQSDVYDAHARGMAAGSLSGHTRARRRQGCEEGGCWRRRW